MAKSSSFAAGLDKAARRAKQKRKAQKLQEKKYLALKSSPKIKIVTTWDQKKLNAEVERRFEGFIAKHFAVDSSLSSSIVFDGFMHRRGPKYSDANVEDVTTDQVLDRIVRAALTWYCGANWLRNHATFVSSVDESTVFKVDARTLAAQHLAENFAAKLADFLTNDDKTRLHMFQEGTSRWIENIKSTGRQPYIIRFKHRYSTNTLVRALHDTLLARKLPTWKEDIAKYLRSILGS